MTEKSAPTKQLLVTRDNITDVVNRIYIKKSDVLNPHIVESLRHLCDVVERDKKEIEAHPMAPFKNPQRMLAIFLMRKEILENASEIYIENNEDVLFAEAIDELEVILKILEEHTITK
jgi:hypothetical protein